MKSVKLVRVSITVVSGIVAALFGGCANSSSRAVVPHAHTGQMFKVEPGIVIDVREVMIEGRETNVGIWGGGLMGGALGSAVGHGVGTRVASAAGAIGGMVAGREIEKAVTKADGYEITVQLDGGDQVMVIQKAEDGGFMDGDRVRVMVGSGGTTRVLH